MGRFNQIRHIQGLPVRRLIFFLVGLLLIGYALLLLYRFVIVNESLVREPATTCNASDVARESKIDKKTECKPKSGKFNAALYSRADTTLGNSRDDLLDQWRELGDSLAGYELLEARNNLIGGLCNIEGLCNLGPKECFEVVAAIAETGDYDLYRLSLGW